MKVLAPTTRRTLQRICCSAVRTSLFIPLVLSMFLIAPGLNAQGSSVRVETFAFRPNGNVSIENSQGATRVSVWEERTVRVVAEKRGNAASPLHPSDLVLMGAGDTIIVQCKRPTGSGRIDLMIYVPMSAHIEITGGSWPVEVSGSLSGATIDTTTGPIDYQLPRMDDARFVMRSARGLVKSAIPLVDSERMGIHDLQGRIGAGSAPISLSSQTGNITLAAAAGGSLAARTRPPAQQVDGGRSVVAQAQQDTAPAGYSTSQRGYGRDDSRTNAQQGRSVDPGGRDPRTSSSAPAQGSGGYANRNPGGWVDLGGSSSNDNASVEYKSGPMERPTQRKSTSTGGSGLRVRIIPSNQPLGATRDDNSMYDDPKNDPKNDDNDPIFNPTNSRDSQSSSRMDTAVPRGGSSQTSRPAYDQPAGNSRSSRPAAVDDTDDRNGQLASTGSRSNTPPELRRSNADNDSADPSAAAKASPDSKVTPDDAIKLNSSVVNLNVVVTDRSGKALANLKKEDFQLAENGEAQTIEFFAPSTAPFNMVLLLDLSGSIQDKIDTVKAAALKFIDVIGPNDKVAVVTFTHEVRVISQLTSNRDLLRTRIQSIPRAVSGTAFYEAMWFTIVDTLRGTEGQRNAIVVMTDGVDSSLDRYNPAPTRVSFNRLAGRLEESDVIVFPIYLDTEYEEVFERQQSTTEAYAMARSQLEKIAELTGGQVFQAQEAKDLAGVYKQVAAALRTVYSVGYYPTNGEKDGSYRRVKVGVDRNGAAVRTRRGYYAK